MFLSSADFDSDPVAILAHRQQNSRNKQRSSGQRHSGGCPSTLNASAWLEAPNKYTFIINVP
jgi:hypothetical protein